jgi:hypothetical protein
MWNHLRIRLSRGKFVTERLGNTCELMETESGFEALDFGRTNDTMEIHLDKDVIMWNEFIAL